jgi:hypothetical protein
VKGAPGALRDSPRTHPSPHFTTPMTREGIQRTPGYLEGHVWLRATGQEGMSRFSPMRGDPSIMPSITHRQPLAIQAGEGVLKVVVHNSLAKGWPSVVE